MQTAIATARPSRGGGSGGTTGISASGHSSLAQDGPIRTSQ